MSRHTISLAALALAAACLASCSGDTPVTPPAGRSPRVLKVDPYGTKGYRTTRDALAVAIDGDTIVLASGRHKGDGNRDLDIGDRSLVIHSEKGDPEYCILDAEGYYLSPPEPHFHLRFRGHHVFGHLSEKPPVVVVEGIKILDGYESISCDSATAPVFRNCIFERSYQAVTVTAAKATFIDCSFEDNRGALLCADGSNVTVKGGRLWQNYSFDSGAGIWVRSSTLRVSDCQFIRNYTTDYGSAIYTSIDYWGARPNITISNCRFHFNGPNESMMLNNADFLVANSIFSDNDGPIFIYRHSTGRVTGSVFYGNGIYLGTGSSATIESSMIVFVGAGPGLDCASDGEASVTLSCTDLWGNTDDCGMEQIGINGNVSVDPLFCYFVEGDYRLYPESPLVQNTACLPAGGWPVGCGPVSAAATVRERR